MSNQPDHTSKTFASSDATVETGGPSTTGAGATASSSGGGGGQPRLTDAGIAFACPQCERSIVLDRGFAGGIARCPRCQAMVRLPDLMALVRSEQRLQQAAHSAEQATADHRATHAHTPGGLPTHAPAKHRFGLGFWCALLLVLAGGLFALGLTMGDAPNANNGVAADETQATNPGLPSPFTDENSPVLFGARLANPTALLVTAPGWSETDRLALLQTIDAQLQTQPNASVTPAEAAPVCWLPVVDENATSSAQSQSQSQNQPWQWAKSQAWPPVFANASPTDEHIAQLLGELPALGVRSCVWVTGGMPDLSSRLALHAWLNREAGDGNELGQPVALTVVLVPDEHTTRPAPWESLETEQVNAQLENLLNQLGGRLVRVPKAQAVAPAESQP